MFGFGDDAENTYQIRPNQEEKFNKSDVKRVIDEVLAENLDGVDFNETLDEKNQKVTNEILERVQALGMSQRYKFIVDAKVGELRGQGVTCGMRAIWDSDSDKSVHSQFKNEQFFCSVIVFGIYFN